MSSAAALFDARTSQTGLDQPRRRHAAVADVLHEDSVGGARDRERHRDTRGREPLQHRELVVGPVLPEHGLPVPRFFAAARRSRLFPIDRPSRYARSFTKFAARWKPSACNSPL